jgi:hypothetical protein
VKQLIEALTIFAKYNDQPYPTNCSHDELAIMGITREEMSGEDILRVEALGFLWDDTEEYWLSYKYGSA